MAAIEFLTRAGQTSTPFRQDLAQLSSVLGVISLIDALHNPPVGTETESSNLGPFFTEDAPDGKLRFFFFCADDSSLCDESPASWPAVPFGESIASEGKGEYMYVEGHVRDTSGTPIPGAVIDTWETDDKGERDPSSVPIFPHSCHRCGVYFPQGLYDVQYADRVVPDCRGRLMTDKDGKYGYRAVVPISYPIPVDVSLHCLLASALPAFGVLNPALSSRAVASLHSYVG